MSSSKNDLMKNGQAQTESSLAPSQIPVSLRMTETDVYRMQFESDTSDRFCVLRASENSVEFEHDGVDDAVDKQLIVECVQGFHKSRQTLYDDVEPQVTVWGTPVTSTKRKLRPVRIDAGAELGQFNVEINCDGESKQYDFVADKALGSIIGINGNDEFWQDIGGELHAARPLIQALIAFYQLRYPE
ncbi:hypothetical protein KF728_09735 [Candidatus Obscuribacterales bacterium]|nr:hypothetical protein [Candidatus Obscuribacterales bacterium]